MYLWQKVYIGFLSIVLIVAVVFLCYAAQPQMFYKKIGVGQIWEMKKDTPFDKSYKVEILDEENDYVKYIPLKFIDHKYADDFIQVRRSYNFVWIYKYSSN